MGIYDKLEEIRKKPEHIRRRYVWAMVTISMFFVVMIWFFSLKSGQTAESTLTQQLDNSGVTEQLNVGKQNFQDIKDSIGGINNK